MWQQAIHEGELAKAAAEQLGDRESIVHCLNTIGSSLIVSGRVDEGCEQLERSRALARSSCARIRGSRMPFVNLGSACGEVYRFDLADNYLRRGIEFCSERDIDFSRLYQLAWQALVWMYRGRWTEASGHRACRAGRSALAGDCSYHCVDRAGACACTSRRSRGLGSFA